MRFWGKIGGVLMCLFALQATAAPIAVRSGAHDGFSRLVLDVPANTKWNLENQDTFARVTLQEHADGFDIGAIFERIDRARVADVIGSASFLDIQFGCDCTVTAFEQGTQMIVLDIAAAPEIPLADQVATDLRDPQPLPFGTVAPMIAGQSVPFNVVNNDLPVNGGTSLGLDPNTRISEAQTARLQQAQDQITEEFSVAASRGLLSPRERPIDLPFREIKPQIDTGIFDSSAQPLPPNDQIAMPDGSNLRITSSADVPTNVGISALSTSLGASCTKPEHTSILEWASDQPFSAQIATHRNALYSEFDRLDADAAVRLSKTYLYFGFGAEARQILLMDPKLAEMYPGLMEIAEIMEYGSARNPSYLHHFVECDTDFALWAILSKPSIEPSTQINSNAALRTVTALPMHLRQFIAPELSRRLLEYGEPDAAAAALRSLERAADQLLPNANLARANLDLMQGNVAEGQDRLAQVVSSNVEQSAAALIQFIDSHLDADAKIDQSVATLVEGYALQMRDDPIGAELRRAHVLALGKSGQFDAAFEALDRVRERDAASMDITLKSSILALLTQNASDIEFLDHVFEQMAISLGQVDPDAKIKIADRLADLGFAREAETVLAARSDFPRTTTTRLLRARIALQLNRPFEAEALIYGIDTPEADKLRARAKTQSGAFEAASEILQQLGEEDGSQQTAWLANSWTVLIEDDAPVFGDIARVAQTELPENTDIQGMLSRTSAAISESAAARAAIQDLLRTAAVVNEPDP